MIKKIKKYFINRYQNNLHIIRIYKEVRKASKVTGVGKADIFFSTYAVGRNAGVSIVEYKHVLFMKGLRKHILFESGDLKSVMIAFKHIKND